MNNSESCLNKCTILVTGCAGFIGHTFIAKLLDEYKNIQIIGVDDFSGNCEDDLKEYRMGILNNKAKTSSSLFVPRRISITEKKNLDNIFKEYTPSIVVNLAAKAGVRRSIDKPDEYINSNLIGFYNILESCRHSLDSKQCGVKHLVYASSSSVYGGNKKVPFSESDPVDHPVSLYAATKKSNELLAHSYSKLYNIPCTGLRFFTVYGPAGRPDMAYFSFAKKMRAGKKIKIFNYGDCMRDFTYVDDIVEGIIRVIQSPPKKIMGDDGLPIPPYDIYNIGNSHPENLMHFVHILSEELIRAEVLPASFDIEEHMELVSMQPGDVPVTYADTSKFERDFGYKPSTNLRIGLRYFAEWFKEYYKNNGEGVTKLL